MAQQQTHDKVKDLTKSSVQDLRIGSNVSPQRLFFYQKCRPRLGPVPIITLHPAQLIIISLGSHGSFRSLVRDYTASQFFINF